MTFEVSAGDLRGYALTLHEQYSEVADAKSYTHLHGQLQLPSVGDHRHAGRAAQLADGPA
jgi:hypothetical protein